MKAERWQKLDKLFHSAVERKSEERAAFLLALFAKPRSWHGTYVAEKVEFALHEGVRPQTLEALLDEDNRARYFQLLNPVL